MKGFILGILVSIVVGACAMGGKSYQRPERAQSLKDYVSCRDPWMKASESNKIIPAKFNGTDKVGKLCNRFCEKRGKKKKGHLVAECKIWKTSIKDYSQAEDFNFFLNGGYRFSNRWRKN